MRVTATAILAALLPLSHAVAQEGGASLSANMINADEQEVGTVTFNETASGMVHIVVEMTDLPPGPHGFHVHETGACDAGGGFESAGGHYAGDMEHGVLSEGGPHPGDLPNVHAGQDGVLRVEFFTDRVSVSEDGENPLQDDDGSAVVVHANPDDYSSQPSGEAGERIACGVIE
ncbi:superoxide dismutase family protein [Chelativorans salis]|uniref:Superoxide dismutase family protein n=1 Tax=Chelativorans salis TaxID=2978478 RepID=A0ABT2LPM6_9HYPH|nr:superoxide dismutase family protein [Chelativorans sp. EGI FJ00035]MCT7376507.1 superoxide dismutase family protein [Chelativorans sp. EGI FJ00035]